MQGHRNWAEDIVKQHKLSEEQTQQIMDWKIGKTNKFVTEKEAGEIVGLTAKNNKSTSSRFKPGETYFKPSLKIHKMGEAEIKPGCDPPARLISCLQEGVTKRSDVFVAEKWLKSLENDVCSDIVKDTTSTLIWLDEVNSSFPESRKNNFIPFTFDFQALYDSLTPDLVIEAVRYAISLYRTQWSADFVEWLIQLINISLSSGVGVFQETWYQLISGISTGGSLSVQLANITVYYVLNKCIYNNGNLNRSIIDIKRFIDDGVGIYEGNNDQFITWKRLTTELLSRYNLIIKDGDWKVAHLNEYVNFLDIKFGFDNAGQLQTDLYRKETDSTAYLNFDSCHPNHMFSSIVYSQAIRLRKIINNNERLDAHLNEMKNNFKNCGYPKKMVENIIEKVKTLPRILVNKERNNIKNDNYPLRVVSTFGGDTELCDTLKSVSGLIPFKLEYVKKTGASLNSRLCKSKFISTGPKYGITTRCGRRRCKACNYMSNKAKIRDSSGKVHKSGSGNCTTRNCIYLAECKLCNIPYVGKTTQMVCGRISEHKSCYNKYRKNKGIIPKGEKRDKDFADKYTLGMHLYNDHNINNPEAFEESYQFTILEKCSPKSLEVKEHLWTQKLKTLYPAGLNLYSPLGFPILV